MALAVGLTKSKAPSTIIDKGYATTAPSLLVTVSILNHSARDKALAKRIKHKLRYIVLTANCAYKAIGRPYIFEVNVLN